ncbi:MULTISPECIES: N-acetyltransferase [Clostridium]|jgi:putative acetyltransferase|uniref:Putative N-acetyltransferase YjaB n=2 Tax=Clostridium TaxID=1485 RepID=A0A151ARK9_9CLOT|nr:MULTISPECIES: N-acetyltransferase [Clostridium]KYH30037.1 putative N-acetyltransferase YjaB [Clostridium colicanis DSM 13634]MBE6044238.1 N-acetyltransferase [Clostridium thermopalmarium]PRR71526.1 putative N-acetyltransferase YjaB [Clostridium thermopalmarium DSM 5974]PVZ20812.1 putative acetyltransferase [Clostridium thermopalmarium DSM 5974]
MIRNFEITELKSIMRIWLESNIKAHDFIDKSYWQDNYDLVQAMLPNATIFVYEEKKQIQGFIGLMGNYIAGIFVEESNQSKGIGKELLNYVKKSNSKLLLQVYKKNVRAVKFYEREDFVILKEQIDVNTGEIEFVMKWTKREC